MDPTRGGGDCEELNPLAASTIAIDVDRDADSIVAVRQNVVEMNPGQGDLGCLILSADGSFERLKQLAHDLSDADKIKYLTQHYRPASSDSLHCHDVRKKSGKSWKVSFQRKWMDDYEWLSYSNLAQGGICRYCVLFHQDPERGGLRGGRPHRTKFLNKTLQNIARKRGAA